MHEHVAYRSLHPMHYIYISVSYLHICDRSLGAKTRGTTEASTIILEFIFILLIP
jgi:hypothetical protein